MKKQVNMVALRRFPLAQGGTSRRLVNKGEVYSIPSTLAAFHENTGRGKRKAQPKPKAKGA
jgi:hypothetical protein